MATRGTGAEGVWIFDWILDGRDIQDVLLHTTLTGRVGRGNTIRIYDPVEQRWQMAFFGLISRIHVMLTARADGDSIQVEGREGHDLLRWSFHDITENGFLWRGHVSADGGTTWHHEQEMRARRRTAGLDG